MSDEQKLEALAMAGASKIRKRADGNYGSKCCCMCGRKFVPETCMYEGDTYYDFVGDYVCDACVMDYIWQHRTMYHEED